MRVAAVQFKANKGDKVRSLARLAHLAEAAAAGSDLVVLPEMAATGYLFPSREAIAPVTEVAASGETFAALAPVARTHGAWLVAGFAERDRGRYFNSALVIDPAGELRFVYRKTLLYEADLPWCEPGDSGYELFETAAGSFTVGICMDLNDLRFTDWCAERRPRAIAFPTNWLDDGERVWRYWTLRLAGAPGVALVAANTYGEEGDVAFRGESAVLDRGTILVAGPHRGDAILRATL